MMQRISMIGSALSQLGNVMTAVDLTETGPNESVSARMHRQGRRGEQIINVLFFWQRNPDPARRELADLMGGFLNSQDPEHY